MARVFSGSNARGPILFCAVFDALSLSALRVAVRIDDNWYDLTAWRAAHPAGTHWIDAYNNSDATEVMYGFHSDQAMSMVTRLPKQKGDVPELLGGERAGAWERDSDLCGWGDLGTPSA